MRIRRKHNLFPRMEKCGDILIADAESYRGCWLSKFPGHRELHLELGCGKGSFTAKTAANSPDCLLIAVEKVPDAMVMAMERAAGMGLTNVRFIDTDALNLPEMFAKGEVSRIYLNFCDPWPRSHDAKYRLTAPGFLRLYADALCAGGEIHFKTDNDPLFNWSVEMFKNEGWEISELTNDLHKNGANGVMTDYEAQFFAENISINRLVATKTAATKTTADGAPGRMYNAGIDRPYNTAVLLHGKDDGSKTST